MKTILIIGTADTKEEELHYLKQCIEVAGGAGVIMDVGVLGTPNFIPEYSKHDVAEAAGTTNQAVIDLGNENAAMIEQARGASRLAARLASEEKIDGLIAIGGTMATDLALDVVSALPFGFPKMIVSTVAFSPLLPPERIPMDVMMMLWAAGLYGLNALCRTVLRQAANAVLGAAQSGGYKAANKKIIAISSLGTSSLKYIKGLYPALQERGYEVAVFHTTGMGGKALENANAQGIIAAIMDFSLIEVSNQVHGSMVNSGESRLQGGALKTPRIIAAGGVTLIDFESWGKPSIDISSREVYAHNRLISCAALSKEERVASANEIASRVNRNGSKKAFIIPQHGIDEWDKPGQPFHDEAGLKAFNDTLRANLDGSVEVYELAGHINDRSFVDIALQIFDQWVADGIIPKP